MKNKLTIPENSGKCPLRGFSLSGGIGVILEVVNWSQVSNQPVQLESVARVLKLLQAS